MREQGWLFFAFMPYWYKQKIPVPPLKDDAGK